ncbi:hypothetical protein OKW50_005382 [Paraburkholderia youngii]|uniref:hypothetical protein n=1 Tax=Paraburkholderia youngii TaxID=2782701 RepID=UPI0015902A94
MEDVFDVRQHAAYFEHGASVVSEARVADNAHESSMLATRARPCRNSAAPSVCVGPLASTLSNERTASTCIEKYRGAEFANAVQIPSISIPNGAHSFTTTTSVLVLRLSFAAAFAHLRTYPPNSYLP